MSMLLCIDYTAIGGRIRERRQAFHLTQEMLAAQCGVSTSYIGHIERAEKIPSIETLARLSQALGITLDYLVFGTKQRCEQQKCPLYGDLRALMAEYGIVQ